ncbi:hypothetical protein J2Z47_003414 [Cohnella thailandensis]|nr:hypothetical protein [Cohnella thailandensis]
MYGRPGFSGRLFGAAYRMPPLGELKVSNWGPTTA